MGMRKYLFGTGIIGAVMGGLTLLRALRESEEPFTWRTALAWVSWAITLTLAIGAIVDTARASRGRGIDLDSPIHGSEDKLRRRYEVKRAR